MLPYLTQEKINLEGKLLTVLDGEWENQDRIVSVSL